MSKGFVGGCLLMAGLASAAPPAESLPDADQPPSEVERAQRLAAVGPGLSPDQVRRLIGAPHATPAARFFITAASNSGCTPLPFPSASTLIVHADRNPVS